jgi:hypothetical protein
VLDVILSHVTRRLRCVVSLKDFTPEIEDQLLVRGKFWIVAL